ncbi:2-isopropylmalate synthase [Candidatus Haliotispira prima]|uniref:2-isopropylmalate synthase n=1 Tax=Candidatus Haliotispira prima TaxID=3034016 RepID=A0ABY8MF32_9SPIO|nr:2-isopropylmalate synthase [Candidatus Haliotispira prima]
MAKYHKYRPLCLMDRTWPNRVLEKTPRWCSVDLRDGNQALPTPMGIEQKSAFFDKLYGIGFREIEVGFPAASQTEYAFLRHLVEHRQIPSDCQVQVLTQARKHLIDKTITSLESVPKAILHLYNSTSEQQRRITFGKSVKEICQIAVDGVKMVTDGLNRLSGTEITLEYSPESFTGTEIAVAAEICNAVAEEWHKTGRPLIINLPATVELSGPHVYADQIEQFCREFSYDDRTCLSVHTHNDRGCGIAAAEFGVLAGAGRIEGTLFGNGERTGNVDLLTLALNCDSQGLDSGLDFSDIQNVVEAYEQFTGLPVHPRHPYAGNLVFTAFSGSHQDAIKKGLDKRNSLIHKILILDEYRHLEQKISGKMPDLGEHVLRLSNEVWSGPETEEEDPRSLEVRDLCRSFWAQEHPTQPLRALLESELPWDVPYLPIDPKDVGRSYEEVIRVNSQSGKGGLAYILQAEFGIQVPKAMGTELGRDFNKVMDALGRELKKDEVHQYFHNFYVNVADPLQIISYQSSHNSEEVQGVSAQSTSCRFRFNLGAGLAETNLPQMRQFHGQGNGPIDALIHCIQQELPYATKLRLASYSEQAIQSGADSEACTFVALEDQGDDERQLYWGVGRDTDTAMASFLAVVSCYNRFYAAKHRSGNPGPNTVHEAQAL